MEIPLTAHEAAVTATPFHEMVQWLGVLRHVDTALDEQTIVHVGTGDLEAGLVGINTGNEWADTQFREEAFEAVVLDSLQGSLQLSAIQKALRQRAAEQDNPDQAPVTDAEKMVRLRNDALLHGLGRLGVISVTDLPQLDKRAEAALRYRRADIHETADFVLHRRAAQIEKKLIAVSKVATPRQVQVTVPSIEPGASLTLSGTVYARAEDLATLPDQRAELGVRGTTPTAIWWEELTRDILRIRAFTTALRRVASDNS